MLTEHEERIATIAATAMVDALVELDIVRLDRGASGSNWVIGSDGMASAGTFAHCAAKHFGALLSEGHDNQEDDMRLTRDPETGDFRSHTDDVETNFDRHGENPEPTGRSAEQDGLDADGQGVEVDTDPEGSKTDATNDSVPEDESSKDSEPDKGGSKKRS